MSATRKIMAIFDIDGCISDDEWRHSLIKQSGEKRYAEYHSMAHKDEILHHGYAVLRNHFLANHEISFITARPLSMFKDTNKWIQKQFPQLATHYLYMRRDDEEGIGAVEIKRRRLAELRDRMQPDDVIIAAYDDRPDIIAMYIDHGISGARILNKKGVFQYAGQETVLPYSESIEISSVAPKITEAFNALLENTISHRFDAPKNAADMLEASAATFRERNAVYKGSDEILAKVMEILFPNGVQIRTAADHRMYHLFELLIVKLTRFTQSGLTHQDSIHDLAVYAAWCESLVKTHEIKFKEESEKQ